jgi:hypothetical protein
MSLALGPLYHETVKKYLAASRDGIDTDYAVGETEESKRKENELTNQIT